MTSLQPEFAPYSETIENVTLACKPLSREECKRFFDRDIIDKGYQPVQMTVVNSQLIANVSYLELYFMTPFFKLPK